MDSMYIFKRSIMQMVDEVTRFFSVFFLWDQATKEPSKTIQKIWCLFHNRPPDYVMLNWGSVYRGKEVTQSAKAFAIRLDEARTEELVPIGTVKRYRAALRLVYEQICANTDHQTNEQ